MQCGITVGLMFTKCKNVGRLDLKKSVNKPFENVSRHGRIQNFFHGQRYQSSTFLSVFSPAK